ncbi:MAG: hypothetical protein AAF752_13985, partial [Bacteroidota bacterium]
PTFARGGTLGFVFSDDGCNAIKGDADGNTYLAGTYAGTFAFGDGIPSASSSADNGYVAKVNPNGSLGWVRLLTGNGSVKAVGVVVDGSGNVTVAGTFTGTSVDVEGATLTGAAPTAVTTFMASYTAAGVYRWGFALGGSGTASMTATDLELDLTSSFQTRFVLSGNFSGTVEFDPTSGQDIRSSGQSLRNGFLIRITDTGASFGYGGGLSLAGTDDIEPLAVTSRPDGYALVGHFRGEANFDPNGPFVITTNAVGGTDGFIARYTPALRLSWAVGLGSFNADAVRDVVFEPGGTVYVAGDFTGTVDFDPGAGSETRTSNQTSAQTDAFIAEYSASGGFGFVRQIGGPGADRGQSVARTADGNVHVGGYFSTGSAQLDGTSPLLEGVVRLPDRADVFRVSFQPPAANNAAVAPKAILGGAFDSSTGSMRTTLLSGGSLPNAQPFNQAPWNYTGSETATSFPSGTVDWVLVCLRTSVDPSTQAGCRAGLLLDDGRIRDLNGTNPLNFSTVPAGDYYVVVYHRNHIPTLSAQATTLNGSGPVVDLTQANGFFDTNGQVEVTAGVWALWPGDADADGQVTARDALVVTQNTGQTGYLAGDLDLNAQVNVTEIVSVWIEANGQ